MTSGWGVCMAVAACVAAFAVGDTAASMLSSAPVPKQRAQAAVDYSVVWNGPSAGCNHCPNTSSHLTPEKYGILVNPGQSFNGSVMTCFYRIGLWPLLESQGDKWPKPWGNISVKQNGGVPQRANLTAHLEQVAIDVQQQIPDPDMSGYAVIDWEAWRPLFFENWDSLSLYQVYSERLVSAEHPSWNNTHVRAQAQSEFNAGAKAIFLETLALCKKLRPKARWGYYQYPYGMGQTYHDELLWLWEAVDVLAPSYYIRNAHLPPVNQSAWVSAAVLEAQRCQDKVQASQGRRPELLPYSGIVYRTSSPPSSEQPPYPLTKGDLAAAVQVPAALGAAGVFLWGSSSDTRDCGKCQVLQEYLTSEAGPVIKQCIENANACSVAHCSGQGRCVSFDASRPEQACLSFDAASLTCRCQPGWKGADCSQQASVDTVAGASADTAVLSVATTPGVAVTPLQLNRSFPKAPVAIDFNTSLPVSRDATVLSLHEDASWGVPWNHFMAVAAGDSAPPAPPQLWVDHIRQLQEALATNPGWQRSGKPLPVLLSLPLVSGGSPARTCPAPNATATSASVGFEGCTSCYDFNVTTNPQAKLVRAAFVAYARYMVDAFRPQFVNHGTEINLYAAGCPAQQWASVVEFANEVYDAVHAQSKQQDITSFPSFQASYLRGANDDSSACWASRRSAAATRPCIRQSLAQVAGLRRDAFALSMYPHGEMVNATDSTMPALEPYFQGYVESIVAELPPSAAGRRGSVFVVETGFLTTPLVANLAKRDAILPICRTLLNANHTHAATWLRYLAGATPWNLTANLQAMGASLDLVTWWSNVDLMTAKTAVACPCFEAAGDDDDKASCALTHDFHRALGFEGDLILKMFATMGVREFDGSPKQELMDAWALLLHR
eukprot:m.153468 g.153468  ORF g.153468 m.153468 type:complete len:892 (-) comp17473_c0_seq3:174-2849(-)